MTTLRRPAAASLLLAVALVACGGGAATTVPTDGVNATDTALEPTPDAPSQGPEATPAATPSGGGGGTDADACDLTTAEDITGVLGQDVTLSMNTPGGVSYCIFSDAAGSAVVATSLMREGGRAAFDLWKAGAGVQGIDGLGDDAVFDPSSATLLVLRGDQVFSVTAGDGTQPEAQRIEWSKAIAEIAIGRM